MVRLSVTPSVCQSAMLLHPTETAEQIEVLFGAGLDPPKVRGGGFDAAFAKLL